MWRKPQAARQLRFFHFSSRRSQGDIISINNGSFYRRYPSAADSPGSNPAIFPSLNFSLQDYRGQGKTPQYWAVVSPTSLARTTFLQVLAGQLICVPPTARSYPYLSTVSSSLHHAVKYVGFDAERGSNVGGNNVRGAYLSARYESRREETDFSLYDYLTGHTELNAIERSMTTAEAKMLDEVIQQLNLSAFMSMPVANLSNGQTRRARIAKALMGRPEVLLLDGPFMGLDPRTLATMSGVLMGLAERQQPRLIMSLRPEDGIPEWVNHLVVIDENLRLSAQGPKEHVDHQKHNVVQGGASNRILGASSPQYNDATEERLSRDGFPTKSPAYTPGEPLVEMSGVKVAYGDKVVLGDWSQTERGEARAGLWWDLCRGQRCGIFGPNGSGKTTMLSLITSDHPQTYSLPIKLFGRSRLPSPGEPGISVFDLQQRMGHSSPEVHSFFPKSLNVRRALSSAWADAPMAKPRLTENAKRRVEACLLWFAKELCPAKLLSGDEGTWQANSDPKDDALAQGLSDSDDVLQWAEDTRFGELSFSNQRLVLFLRAIVSSPDLVILDEALSGIDEVTRDKALLFLSHGEKVLRVVEGKVAQQSSLDKRGSSVFTGLSPDQALLVISHSKEDVPGCLREWICLPEPGEGRPPRTGTLPGPLELNPHCWHNEIWAR